MIESLLVALIYIGVACIIGWVIVVILKQTGVPPIVPTVVWAVIGIVCLLILLNAITGGTALQLE